MSGLTLMMLLDPPLKLNFYDYYMSVLQRPFEDK